MSNTEQLIRNEGHAIQSCATIVLPFNPNSYRSDHDYSNAKQQSSSDKKKVTHKRIASTNNNMSINTFVHEDVHSSGDNKLGSMPALPYGTSINNSTAIGLEEQKMHEDHNSSAVTVREVEAQFKSNEKEQVMQKIEASISKTKEHLRNNATLSSNSEIKVYNIEDSHCSNQFDIVIHK